MAYTVSWETLEGVYGERPYPTRARADVVWQAIVDADRVNWSEVHAPDGDLVACHYGKALRGAEG